MRDPDDVARSTLKWVKEHLNGPTASLLAVASAYLLATTLAGTQRAGVAAAVAMAAVIAAGIVLRVLTPQTGVIRRRPIARVGVAAALGVLGGTIFALLSPAISVTVGAGCGAAALMLVDGVREVRLALRGRLAPRLPPEA